MLRGFKEFILRGNVIELAVAVVIGAAFTAIVNTIVSSLITPLIGALFDAENLEGALILRIPTLSGGTAELGFGAVIAAVIQFLVVAAVVYFALVVPINRLSRSASLRGEEEQTAPPAEVRPTQEELLTQIRDLLAGRPSPEGDALQTGDAPRL